MTYVTTTSTLPTLGETIILRDEMLRTDIPVDPRNPARMAIGDEVVITGLHTRLVEESPEYVSVVAIEVKRADGATSTLDHFEDFKRLTRAQKAARTRERNARLEDGPRW